MMRRLNLRRSSRHIPMQPLVFEPFFRPQIWGSRRLHSHLGRQLPGAGTFGESWEVSGHPLHVSRVATGPWSGTSLQQLWDHERSALLGSQPCTEARFPWLLKYLDCHDQLSVQVHPGDAGARRHLLDDLGKAEAWVVLDAEPGAMIGAGLKPGVDRRDFERQLDAGTITDCLHTFTPRPGDCLFLPPGAVHTAGGGVLIWELQRCSDATLRLFDWNRRGPDGRTRPLHPLEALDCIDFSLGPVRPSRWSQQPVSQTGELLFSCEYFEVRRCVLKGTAALMPGMALVTVVAGSAELHPGRSSRLSPIVCNRGDVVLLPATCDWNWQPDPSVELLVATLPTTTEAATES